MGNQFPARWRDAALRGAFYEAWGQRLAIGFQRDVGTIWSVQFLAKLLLGMKEMRLTSVEEWCEDRSPFKWVEWPGAAAEHGGTKVRPIAAGRHGRVGRGQRTES